MPQVSNGGKARRGWTFVMGVGWAEVELEFPTPLAMLLEEENTLCVYMCVYIYIYMSCFCGCVFLGDCPKWWFSFKTNQAEKPQKRTQSLWWYTQTFKESLAGEAMSPRSRVAELVASLTCGYWNFGLVRIEGALCLAPNQLFPPKHGWAG